MAQLANDKLQALKYRCQTDLFFLTKEILGKSKLTEETHRSVCDFFVKKDPDKPIEEQDDIKKGLLLYPRGSFKSTINVADCVQWIICFPNVSIMILTAADDLATDFVNEVADYFIIKDEPTLFQQLFREHCVEAKKVKGFHGDGWFQSPARKVFQKEPTIQAASIESNTAGKHVDVVKADDVVSETNSETITQLKKLDKKLDMATNLLKDAATSYFEIIGTRYNLEDPYGKRLEIYEIPKPYGEFRMNGFKYVCKPAWWLKDTDYQIPTEEESASKENIELLFPQSLTWGVLRGKQKANKENFASQQLNDPVGASDVTFLKEDLVQASVPHTAFPPEGGKIFIAWDLAYSTKKKTDFTVGAVGLFDKENRIWILDVIRGKYQPHELPYVIVKAIADWRPDLTAIENSTGAQWLLSDMSRWANQMQVPLNIDWFTVDNKTGAKDGRIKSLETYLKTGRLKFSSGIACLNDLYKEFTTFPDGSHDDIPDAIGHLLRYSNRSQMNDNRIEAAKKVIQEMKEKDLYDRIYCQGVYAQREPETISFQETEYYDPVTGLPF